MIEIVAREILQILKLSHGAATILVKQVLEYIKLFEIEVHQHNMPT